jgi:prepilin-type processing-associated H-X9-DG protein
MIGVLVIIAILVSLLMPGLARTRATARQVECMSHQRQMGIAMALYVKKNDQVFPAHRNNSQTSGWFTLIFDEVDGDTGIFSCPSRSVWECPGPHGFGTPHKIVLPRAEDSSRQWAQHYMPYGYNGYWLGLSPYPKGANPMPRNFCRFTDLRNPAEVIVLADSELKNAADHWSQSIWYPFRTLINEGISDLHRGGANVLFADGHVAWYDDRTINVDPDYAGWWSPDPTRWK